jgi:starch synthase
MNDMARVLMVASEATPFVKTGGLADVLGGLPPALAKLGEEVAVVIPKYRKIQLSNPERLYHEMPVWLGATQYLTTVDRVMDRGVAYLFVNCAPLFDREGIYNVGDKDFPDNHIRFAVFCGAALEVVRRIFRPNVLHLHDWQASLVAPYLRVNFRSDPTFFGIRQLLTIHNLGYQGIFAPFQAAEIGLDPAMVAPSGPMEFFGDLNLLKGGIVFTDAVNTVSKAYAREIQTPEFGFGLDGLLRSRSNVLEGILNGVDYAEWNPEHDKYIPRNYGIDSLDGKRDCKRGLLETFGLPTDLPDRPVIGVITRFAAQKGFDLFAGIARELLEEDVCLTVLGAGDPQYEQLFRELAAAYPDRVGVRIGYDNPLAHSIEAGADMFLMPSRYEPCGLNQIYSLRYGTVPIVRATGGLDDTIGEGTGFKFSGYTGRELLECIRAALAAWQDKDGWQTIVRRGMMQDFSWDVSAGEYRALYRRLLKQAETTVAA